MVFIQTVGRTQVALDVSIRQRAPYNVNLRLEVQGLHISIGISGGSVQRAGNGVLPGKAHRPLTALVPTKTAHIHSIAVNKVHVGRKGPERLSKVLNEATNLV